MQESPLSAEPHDALGASDTEAMAKRKRPKPGERRVQILQTLAAMLEQPRGEKPTTAALAARLQVSEAALYRHFASKAQMFEGLIEFIEQSVFGLINQITARQEDGLHQARDIVHMLLAFAAANPGMTRVLTGDALVNEDERLQERINQLYERIEASLRQCLRTGLAQHPETPACEPAEHAALLLAYVLGRWTRYAKSGFRKVPSANIAAQLAVLLG